VTVQELLAEYPDLEKEDIQAALLYAADLVNEKRMIVTMDKDFGDLVYHSGKRHSGILLLRLEAATGDQKVKVVERIIRIFKKEIRNKFCVYQDDRLRIKK
jgi:predicted nuclease of predicted toxin-antitoxin system